jgi:glycerophosphoryl diester phosphodiesterase
MGAGILECDVSFTSDLGLVCRHSLCDLHTTTDILLRPELAKKCTTPFTPANGTHAANALCCTSDITLTEFTTLCGKQDGFNASATNVEDYQYGTPTWRTELYDTCGTVMTLNSYIDLVESLPGYRNFTPELKTPPSQVPMPFHGYTQEQYARDMIEAFIKKGIDPTRVWPQSFNPPDIYQWIAEYPEFGKQAVFLDEDGDDAPGPNYTAAVARLPSLKAKGVNIISPPFPYLLTYGDAQNKTIVPSSYATTAKAAGLDIIAWSFDRSGPLAKVKASDDYYYFTIADATHYDGQLYQVLDILANQIGIVGLFSDWSGTVTYFANCFNLKGPNAANYKALNAAK